ncbi:SpoIIE family protein phosphatase [Thalassospiraceae bacterium LMO-JJ14]|nr:SpoIIE family protein phosphatase [Thalassospiraceae bacterium LMO-JJ14]
MAEGNVNSVELSSGARFGVAPGDAHSHLELLADMGRDFATSLDLEATLARAVQRITDYVDAEAGALFMLSPSGEKLLCDACVGPVEITGLEIAADQGIVGFCVQNDSGRIVRDVAKDPDFNASVDDETGFKTKSILCAPMSVKGEQIGAIELINKRGGDGLFDDNDLHLLQALSVSAGLAVLNARMAAALVEQERVKRELELAAEIQRSLLPEEKDSDFPVKGINLPARVVSGDFYDFYPLDDGRVAFTLGDVSGKGMNAALMMAKTASLLRCLGKSIKEPGRLLTLVNEEICETATRGMFVTLVHGVYDPDSGYVRLANAGHEPPLIYGADGSFRAIEAEAPPLGISPALLDEDGFPETELNLNGGQLFVFTDGVTEGYIADGVELGADGLKELIANAGTGGVQGILNQVREKIGGTGEALRDDVTLLAIDDGTAKHTSGVALGAAEPGATDAPGEKIFQLRVTAKANRLRLIRNAVRETASFCGFSEADTRDIVLAVDEACQNVIRHAYGHEGEGDIAIEIRHRPDAMVLFLRDFADPVDISKIKPRDLDDLRPGGLGTHLISEVMDEVDFLPPPIDGGNLLRMVKRIGD